ncbi:Os10g0493300, partial [Oryza sativa Japonica Group]
MLYSKVGAAVSLGGKLGNDDRLQSRNLLYCSWSNLVSTPYVGLRQWFLVVVCCGECCVFSQSVVVFSFLVTRLGFLLLL